MLTPEINPRRAAFVLGKIDEILSWERTMEQEKDVRFVELGEYLCEVRARQYWRLDNLNSFDKFLEKRFADSRRKAYYLMAIHEKLTRIPKHELQQVGWSKATELVKVAAQGWRNVRLCNLVAQSEGTAEGRVQMRGRTAPNREGNGAVGDFVLQSL
jgi:hypothetical protein